jgi:hypothetical protein
MEPDKDIRIAMVRVFAEIDPENVTRLSQLYRIGT